MGGNVSKDTKDRTIEAFTLYGFGFERYRNDPNFFEGAPASSGCGVSMSSQSFDPTEAHRSAIRSMQEDLSSAAEIAMNDIRWTSHIVFSGFDRTAARAAKRLNDTWCSRWNDKCLNRAGLYCHAASELHGFGRTRVTYLVIRIMSLPPERPVDSAAQAYSQETAALVDNR